MLILVQLGRWELVPLFPRNPKLRWSRCVVDGVECKGEGAPPAPSLEAPGLTLLCSTQGQRTRDVILRIPADYQSLGLALQWAPLSVTDQIWHILDVAAQSPADMAGLLPYSDYIIGSPEYMLRGESSLYELVEEVRDWLYRGFGHY